MQRSQITARKYKKLNRPPLTSVALPKVLSDTTEEKSWEVISDGETHLDGGKNNAMAQR